MSNHNDWSTPSQSEPVPSWLKYNQLRGAAGVYPRSRAGRPEMNAVWRALATITGECQRGRFVDAIGLDEPIETARVRRPMEIRKPPSNTVI